MARNQSVFTVGDRVQLKNAKGKPFTFVLEKGGVSHSHKGVMQHDNIIGKPYASLVENEKGEQYIAMRPKYADTALALKRGAAIIYPKDAAQICLEADIKAGDRVLECGLGSGSLASYILQILGETGELISFEKEEKFAKIAVENVGERKNWKVIVDPLPKEKDSSADSGPFSEGGSSLEDGSSLDDGSFLEGGSSLGGEFFLKYKNYFSSAVFDMLDPWNYLSTAYFALQPGGILVCYITTVTQLSRLTEKIREANCWSDPDSFEIIRRPWHIEGLAVRPVHSMIGHTGFILCTRALAQGSHPLKKKNKKQIADVDEK
ncbi:MAG: tRNA (adenine-N1)-methyltransferase [Bifidobacteriaceae bacterium]|jgi:tRNA (adenine57-N1/adenine58-N1)-methyltransferase|nr:tRNA (adenine-N1)-methyltransferase [Bifidobacteriaceae bacterium]